MTQMRALLDDVVQSSDRRYRVEQAYDPGEAMSSDSDKRDDHDQHPKRRTETLWRIGIVVALMAWFFFLIYIAEDPGPVCGTGQDKGPC
ncbi:hypothetical protein [Streptomyces sp. DSM 40750]|uniref:hypothetical protein n=1 Tax=Streptomyces sp. DSM 40750 TaxID=2801030 RepID=UPI00214C373A|nr:hypothetical protein [Streptomyces sp. DSM 40750]UUU18899.1 hypothetical protein JIX55_00180 [Streptomyces sp. DSM 40750]UUU27758.1 hypothetical protein JIX55_50565 [Streptomyces sp. DSM 40750]